MAVKNPVRIMQIWLQVIVFTDLAANEELHLWSTSTVAHTDSTGEGDEVGIYDSGASILVLRNTSDNNVLIAPADAPGWWGGGLLSISNSTRGGSSCISPYFFYRSSTSYLPSRSSLLKPELSFVSRALKVHDRANLMRHRLCAIFLLADLKTCRPRLAMSSPAFHFSHTH